LEAKKCKVKTLIESVETIPRIRGDGTKENDGEDEFN
jgi:hypothetical protein